MITLKKNHLNLLLFPVGNYQCNCSILYSDQTNEAIIIDPGNDHEFILKKIKELHLTVKKLIHTHAHFDHIGRSSEIKKATQSKMYLHQGDLFLYDNLVTQGRFFGQEVGTPLPLDGHLTHDMTFSFDNDIDDLELKDFLKTIHTPGHTPGSCCFYTEYFDVPMLFSGDTLFNHSIGRTDLPGGDSHLILKSIRDRLFSLPDETMVTPGHGELTRIFEEKNENPFF